MPGLFLHCGLCGRKQADGLLSRGHWGHYETSERTLRACPSCKHQYQDWTERLLAASNLAPTMAAPAYGVERSGFHP